MDNLARRQLVIPASEQPEGIWLRVAAYCRVSTDSADQKNSFAAQNTYYTNLIANMENWQMVDIYADEGITGTSAAKRPDFQRLLSDCRSGLIDKILVKSISRFARNTKECLEVIRELKSLGISVQFEEQHIDTKTASSEMLTAVMAALAQAESESISRNTCWGIRKKMQAGTYLAPTIPFGYRKEKGYMVIIEEEAVIIRSIFSHYLRGENAMEISRRLIEESAENPVLERLNWGYTTVIHMLKNETYAGDLRHQKTCGTDSFPSRRILNLGVQEQYLIPDNHPAIIDRNTFAAVQSLLERRGEGRPQKKVKGSIFIGMLVCGHCGNGFRCKNTRDKRFLSCRTHAHDSAFCDMPQIPEEEIKQAFCRLYYNLKHDGMAILSSMLDDLAIAQSRQMLWNTDIIALNKEISDIKTQSHTLNLLNQRGLVDSDVFISESNQLAQQLHRAKQEKNRLFAAGKDSTIIKTQQIFEILETGPDFLEIFDKELLHELIEKIIVDSNTKIRFRLINDLELPETIERTVR